MDYTPFWITFKLAFITTLLLLIICIPLAWWLARTKNKLKPAFEAVLSLPLILPPTVIGFYLLIFLGPNGPILDILKVFRVDSIAFTFPGLVIGSIFYSLPFVLSPIQDAFNSIDQDTLDSASCLGSSPLDRFFSVVIPIAKPGIITGCILGFAHTIGEFGVVLMLGGNIPGKTQVVSIAIYDHVESLEYASAHKMSAILLVISFCMLLFVRILNKRSRVIKL